jgi:hypothetical protein
MPGIAGYSPRNARISWISRIDSAKEENDNTT